MMQPKVTVLMPVYNAERFLREAIDSILAQTLVDFEFLIIDDGSTDNSVSIINSYADDRIRLIRNEKNLGISATLNKGIECSRAELIARMDADDISYPDRLQRQYDYFSNHPNCALVSSWAREVTEDNQPILLEKFNSSYYPYILNFECWIYHPTVMYKRSAVLKCGCYSEKYCEDYDLWWKLSKQFEIANLSEVLLDYRSTTDSLCRVTKKVEYEAGHQEQILRNVRYYTGNNFELTIEEIDALRYNYDPLLHLSKIELIISFFKKLDHINRCIFKKDSYKGIATIREAAKFKKDNLLAAFLDQLPPNQKLKLLIGIGEWKLLKNYSKNFLSRLPGKIISAKVSAI